MMDAGNLHIGVRQRTSSERHHSASEGTPPRSLNVGSRSQRRSLQAVSELLVWFAIAAASAYGVAAVVDHN